jgi:putative ABC transport system permease protein
MISAPLARRLFGGTHAAIGRHVRVHGRTTWATIVGVVRDIGINNELRSYQWYEPMWAAPGFTGIIIRSAQPPASLELPFRKAIADAVPAAKVVRFVDVEARFRAGQSMHRFVLSLIGCFAVLALLLAVVGLNAVMSYNVRLRWRELGIRLALGAPETKIVRLIVRQGVALGAAGAIIGILGAMIASRTMQTLLFGVTPNDPLTLASVGALLVVLAVAAASIPARLAARIDPVEMLRAD